MNPKIKSWLALALIFLAGTASGAALMFVLGPRFHHPPGPGQMASHIMVRLTRELGLTADQQAKIEPIVNDTAKQIHDVHTEEVGRISQIIKSANDLMTPILNQDQQAHLQKLESEGGARIFFEHLHNRGPMPEGPPPGPAPDGAPPPPPATNAPPQ